MRNINKIIVHCSATPEGRNFTVKQIDACHRQRGFNGIGYHFVIYLDGSVHVGRPLAKAGAHCKGYNAHSIGVCYIGGVAADGKTPKDTRTDTQKASLVKLITELRQQFPNASVHGHREFANEACPCFDAHKEYNDL
jgi:N-acetylmuramoyl-L-alanine amidase